MNWRKKRERTVMIEHINEYILTIKPPQNFHCSRVGNNSNRCERERWIAEELNDMGIDDLHLWDLSRTISELMFKVEHFERECETIDKAMSRWIHEEVLKKITDIDIIHDYDKYSNRLYVYYKCPHCKQDLNDPHKIMDLKEKYELEKSEVTGGASDCTFKERIERMLI